MKSECLILEVKACDKSSDMNKYKNNKELIKQHQKFKSSTNIHEMLSN